MSQQLYALTHGWIGLIFGTLTCLAVAYAAVRLIAARARLPDAKHRRGTIVTSAFATPPSTPLRPATRSYPEGSKNPARKRKWRAQMANSIAAARERAADGQPPK
jgi:hypothetical protein